MNQTTGFHIVLFSKESKERQFQCSTYRIKKFKETNDTKLTKVRVKNTDNKSWGILVKLYIINIASLFIHWD